MGEPFLHWPGGKRQLLNVLDANLPVDIKLYGKFNISRVPARRVINSDPNNVDMCMKF